MENEQTDEQLRMQCVYAVTNLNPKRTVDEIIEDAKKLFNYVKGTAE